MTVISAEKDIDALTLTFVAEFDATVERVWRIWEDPRQLERWWGPPTYPATFEVHDFTVDGRSSYFMTGPEGDRSHGWWHVTAIDAPHRLEFDDGFADEHGEPITTAEPFHCVVTLEPTATGTRMVVVSNFASTEQLEQMLSMGMEEGMRQAMSQIDKLLADG
jgi:uncharacterized protein YndB with AHSA1/START domain